MVSAKRSGGSGGSGASPGRVLILLLVVSLALLWVTPADVRPVREGLEWALTPGVRAVQWAGERAQGLLRRTKREIPPSDALGRQDSYGGESWR